ncbi:MAG TPA: lamin tail domain-containing protein, partial [Planctomycetota bacterium]|nr:lamin tail domain-containing protein [Planctomycetota bacterium]
MSSRVRSRASARRRSLISASLAALAFVSAISAEPLCADVVIHEIHYAPGDKTRRLEFVELRNTASGPVDLSGWFFSDGIDYEFPNGVTIAGDGYAVVAEDPSALAQAYGAAGAYGPFGGKLSNEGERLVLRDAQGELVDEVEYGIGFPWPTAGGDLDLSIELLDPSLDNSLGGSWRLADRGLDDSSHLVPAESVWRYRAGRAEASSPRSAWRTSVFDDSSWTSGPAPIGYGEEFIATVLSDMQGEYASVFLRIEFEVANPSSVGDLALEARFDDGFNAWVNGVHVVSANMPGADVAYDATASSARENLDFVRFDLPDPSGYLVAGRNVLAVQLHNSGVGDSSDAFFDARLTRSGGPRRGPTPGAANAVATSEVPPIIARVAHQPRQPTANATVRIVVETAPVTGDEVAEVFLEHRVVDPGEYVELHDAAYSTGWTRVDLHDDGAAGDDRADDGVYSVLLPPSLQRHRRLVRYRVTVRSAAGRETRVPYADDPVPNFAYFVYDGVPPWSGAIQPGSSDANRRRIVEHSTAALNEVPVYHLITKRSSTENSTWQSRYGGSDYLWWGTLVYDGEVYDHIRFRARGGVWRYAMGKNMWKFNFWRGHRFRARDNHGREYQTEWDKLNFSACIQQGDFL